MEKLWKKTKQIIVLGIVIVIALIGFFGVFKKENGVWRNILPNYLFGKDIEGARELVFATDLTEEEKYIYVDEDGNIKGEVWKDGSAVTEESEQENSDAEETEATEEGQAEEKEETVEEVPYAKETRNIKVNPDEKLTKENFEMSKKIIQERLKEQGINEYDIRIDDVTGKIVIENVNDSDQIEVIEELVSKPGKFQIIDYQNGLILMDNSDIKSASAVYSNRDEYNTYLQIQFTKEGAEKLREMSKKYVEIKPETEETEETEEQENSTAEETNDEETEKTFVSVVFDDDTMMTTYFGEEMTMGMLQISVGEATKEYEKFTENYRSAKTLADMLNTGVLPVTYELETDNFVQSNFTEATWNMIKIVAAILVVGTSVFYVVKFKKNGLIAAVLNIGYLAMLLLIFRFTNVEITINAIIATIVVMALNVIFMNMLLKELQKAEMKQAYREVGKKFYLTIIPMIIVAVVFTLTKNHAISTIGMPIFWGIVLNILYHMAITRNILEK